MQNHTRVTHRTDRIEQIAFGLIVAILLVLLGVGVCATLYFMIFGGAR